MDPAANNRISNSSGYGYDATGNLTSGPGFLYATYDVQNRMATYVPTSGGTEYYSYGPDNLRVWKKPPSGPEEVYFYGAQGEKLGRFSYGTGVFTTLRRSIYIGARVVNEGQDRLESVPDHGGYYPYGEAQTAGFTDQDRFATYYRDGTSMLDYARNRYYSSGLGRFMSADPYRASGGPADPGSWNRYAYAGNDPVNFSDPSGLFYGCPSGDWAACGGGTDPGTGTSPFDPSLWRFVTHFSPSPHTPPSNRPHTREQLVKIANKLKKLVNAKEETDCEALSDFAPAAAENLGFDKASRWQFKSNFGALTPSQFPFYNLIPGVSASSGSRLDLLNSTQAPSGFRSS
jgi:RHS repeat-associated protein